MAKKRVGKLATKDLEAELARREKEAQKLARKREKLIDEVAAIDAELDELGFSGVSGGRGTGTKRGGSRKRPKNDTPLPDVLAKVLKGKTMGVTEIAEAAEKAGYKSSSANFRNIVNQTLLKHPKLFKKVGRGQYTGK